MQLPGPAPPRPAWVDLPTLLGEVASSLGELAQARQVRVDVVPSPIAWPCYVDAEQVRIALACVLRNAIEAAPPRAGHACAVRGRRGARRGDRGGQRPWPGAGTAPTSFDPFYSGRNAGRGEGWACPSPGAWLVSRAAMCTWTPPAPASRPASSWCCPPPHRPSATPPAPRRLGRALMQWRSLMSASPFSPAASAEERLERGEIISFATAPFALPQGEDHAFLLAQQQGGAGPQEHQLRPDHWPRDRLRAQGGGHAEQEDRLRLIFAAFSRRGRLAGRRLSALRPWLSARPGQFQALRGGHGRLRPTARNDLLHIDAFPTRPGRDRRNSRVFANINPTEPRIWATSDPLGKLLARYGAAAGLTGARARLAGRPRSVRPPHARRAPPTCSCCASTISSSSTTSSRNGRRDGCGRLRPDRHGWR